MFHVGQQNQSVAYTKGCSLSAEKAQLLKIITYSVNIEKLGGWQHGDFTNTFQCPCNAKGILMHRTLKEKHGNQKHQKTLDLQPVDPTKCSRAMEIMSLWE